MRPFILAVLATGCLSAPSVTIYGEVDSTVLAEPGPRDLAIIYSPEDAGHSLDALITITEFPTSFVLNVPGPAHSAFEEYGGVDGAAGTLYFANAGTFGDADDGFGTDGSMRLGGYELIYLADPPKSSVFGVPASDLREGWNLLRMAVPSCDRPDYARYEPVPVESVMKIVITGELEQQSWDVGCR